MTPPRRALLVTASLAILVTACPPSTPAGDVESTTPSQTSAPAPTVETAVATASAPTPPSPIVLKTPDYEGVVFTDKSLRDIGFTTVGQSQLDGVWVPRAEDVAAFESGLLASLTKTVPAKNKELRAKVKGYKRQWAGVTAGDKKFIFANFFCDASPGWQQHLVMVDDGGDCYFYVFYDVSSREYLGLMINGDA